MSLATEYERLATTPSDIVDHLPRFVDLAADADRIIELGTRTGVSTVAWLHGLEGHGHLWSVDIDEQPPIGDWPHWTFIQGDDCAGNIFTQLPADVDVVFIDTSHDYLHTLRELHLYRWLLKPGGKLVLHDTELARPMDVAQQSPYPVKRAIVEFCESEGLGWENYPESYGLGIITVP